ASHQCEESSSTHRPRAMPSTRSRILTGVGGPAAQPYQRAFILVDTASKRSWSISIGHLETVGVTARGAPYVQKPDFWPARTRMVPSGDIPTISGYGFVSGGPTWNVQVAPPSRDSTSRPPCSPPPIKTRFRSYG